MRPFTYNGETLGEQRRLFIEPRCRLSLLGLGGGGGGLGLSGSASATSSAANSVGGVTVNNGGLQLNSTTLLIAGAGLLAVLLIFGLFFRRGRN